MTTTPDINVVATAIDAYVRTYRGDGVAPVEVQVRPSGDDLDVIKVWVDLGPTTVDPAAWASACEASIEQEVPGAAGFRVVVRVETT